MQIFEAHIKLLGSWSVLLVWAIYLLLITHKSFGFVCNPTLILGRPLYIFKRKKIITNSHEPWFGTISSCAIPTYLGDLFNQPCVHHIPVALRGLIHCGNETFHTACLEIQSPPYNVGDTLKGIIICKLFLKYPKSPNTEGR